MQTKMKFVAWKVQGRLSNKLRSDVLFLTFHALSKEKNIWGPFLESPENVSGPKNHLWTCQLLVQESRSCFQGNKKQNDCEVWRLKSSPFLRYRGNLHTRKWPVKFLDFRETGPCCKIHSMFTSVEWSPFFWIVGYALCLQGLSFIERHVSSSPSLNDGERSCFTLCHESKIERLVSMANQIQIPRTLHATEPHTPLKLLPRKVSLVFLRCHVVKCFYLAWCKVIASCQKSLAVHAGWYLVGSTKVCEGIWVAVSIVYNVQIEPSPKRWAIRISSINGVSRALG